MPATHTDESYGTLVLRLPASGPWAAAECLAEVTDALQELGAIIAADPGVGGVELRDATTLGGPPLPELCVFCRPESLSTLASWTKELGTSFGLELVVSAHVEDGDAWRDAWKQFYGRQSFGDHQLLLRPSWIPREPGDPACEVVLDPGRAFGTGLHETTRLCVHLLCALPTPPGRLVRGVDLGCGSGILALAMARLWPEAEILAVDDDPEAVDVTRENIAHNGLQARVRAQVGSIDALPAGLDVIVANIRPEVLIPWSERLHQRLAAGGHLLLSGILDGEAEAVGRAYATSGFSVRARRSEGGWTALQLLRPANGP